MSNDLATLKTSLSLQLRDTDNDVWDSDTTGALITQAVADLYPRIRRANDPTASTISLTSGTYSYTLPSGVRDVYRLEQYNSDGLLLYEVSGKAWEITGDYDASTQKLLVGPSVVDVGGTLHVFGWYPYDTSTNLIPDSLVTLVLAQATARAYRMMASSREQFQQWLARNQVQNVSVNEMMQMIGEAQNFADAEWRVHRTWQPPVTGRRA